MTDKSIMIIGLDSFDPDLARAWAAAGELPVLADLLRRGACCEVRNPFGMPGGVWPSFNSALEPVRHRTNSWSEIDLATYRWRVVRPPRDLYRSFWTRIAAAGRQVAAVDVPFAWAAGAPNCLELYEWGTHDRHFGLHSEPPHHAGEIEARFGLHPVFGMRARRQWHETADDFLHRRGLYRTLAEEELLLADLMEGVKRKGEVLRTLMAERKWDLFIGVFSEGHSAGHQFWHVHDSTHPRHDRARRERLGDPLLAVYRAIDAEIGRLAEAAGPDVLLLVHLSHGMAAHYDGTVLLDEVLARIEGVETAGMSATLRGTVKPWLSRIRDAAIRLHVPTAIRMPIARWLRGDGPKARARRRYFAEPNNTVFSGIRFNLVGREPQGKIRPHEVEAASAELTRQLMALVNADRGGPAVRAVHRCDDHHRREPDDCMPDLFVEWERSVPIEAVRSETIGTVRTPYTRIRTGDHLPDGMLIAAGPGIEAGTAPALAVEDIGPSVAARLGVTFGDVDGEVVQWLAGEDDDAGSALAFPIAAEAR